MAKVNMKLTTPVNILLRRDFQPAYFSMLQPDNSVGSATSPIYLLDGEFLFVNGSKIQREGPNVSVTGGDATKNPTAAGAVAKIPTFAFWMERGRTDMQAISGGKATILYQAGREADFTKDVLHASDLSSFKVGDPLYVNWLTNGTDRNRRRGLTKQRAAGEGLIHAYVTRVYPSNSEFVIRAMIIAP